MLQAAPLVLAAAALAGCALPSTPPPDFAAINRPPEERCVRLQDSRKTENRRPGLTRAEVLAEARAAASRGELDRVCDYL